MLLSNAQGNVCSDVGWISTGWEISPIKEGPELASLQIKPISDLETLRARWGEIMAKYRTALLNCKYNAHRLRIKKTQNLWFEIILALGTSSAIGGWTVFKTEPGKPFWAVFSAIVVVLTIVKPIFQIPKEIERFSELHIGYKNLYYDLNKLVSEVNKTGSISDATQTAFEKAKDRLRELSLKDEDPPNQKLLQKCETEVKQENPAGSFWNPQPNEVPIDPYLKN